MTKRDIRSAARHGRALAGMAACASLILCAACASNPVVMDPKSSAWTKEEARTVENGKIVHLGQSETQGSGVDQERAVRNAEAQALQDIANECSFVPKGTRIDARAAKTTATGHQAWARASVSIEACEEAKRATDPSAIRRLANSEFTAQVKRYQQEQAEHRLLLSLVDSGVAADQETSVAPPPAPIRDEVHFYVVRQQVVFAKQEIILSEKGRNPAASQSQTQFKSAIETRTANLRKFEESHPEFKRTPRSWSNFGREAVLHSPWVSPLVRHPDPPVGKARAARWLNLHAQEPTRKAQVSAKKTKNKNLKKKVKQARAKRQY